MIYVAVIRGGPTEYEVSLKTGAAVLEHLPSEKYVVSDILISQDGVWHKRGLPIEPHKALHSVDVVFNAMHGEYGEGGTVQKILDDHGVLYTGSGVFASAIAMNKAKTREVLGKLPGIKTQASMVFYPDKIYDLDAETQKLFNAFSAPYVLKPLRGGSSIGVSIAQTIREVPDTLEKLLKDGPVMIEEYIEGKEATCGVVENLRNEDIYTLPIVEIRVPHGKDFWDYEDKYSGDTEEICPGNFSKEEKQTIQEATKLIHEKLGLRHYSRSDFIVAANGIYFLEVNTLPGLTPESLMPKPLEAIGVPFHEFLSHLISLALIRKRT